MLKLDSVTLDKELRTAFLLHDRHLNPLPDLVEFPNGVEHVDAAGRPKLGVFERTKTWSPYPEPRVGAELYLGGQFIARFKVTID